MDIIKETIIITSPGVLWDILQHKLLTEENYEKLALCKAAMEGKWKGKKIIVKRQFARERYTHCCIVKFLQYYEIEVTCNLCNSTICKEY